MILHSKPWITEEDISVVEAQLSSGMITRGAKTAEFEQSFSEYIKSEYSIAATSGTAAIILALKALNIQAGDEVIMPTYVCKSVSDAIEYTGAKPVLCDVGEYWNMTAETVAPHISGKTKAIIVVHIFGISADTQSFKKFGLPLIEDFCQALGLIHDNKKANLSGNFGVYSFHATKCMTTGEGGMLATNDSGLFEKVMALKNKEKHLFALNDLQAALGLAQLSKYDETLIRRKNIADRYFRGLPSEYTATLASQARNSMFFRFPLTVDTEFEKLRARLEQSGVAVRKGVDSLLHRYYGLNDAQFYNATKLFNKTVSIPILPSMRGDDIQKVIDELTV